MKIMKLLYLLAIAANALALFLTLVIIISTGIMTWQDVLTVASEALALLSITGIVLMLSKTNR